MTSLHAPARLMALAATCCGMAAMAQVPATPAAGAAPAASPARADLARRPDERRSEQAILVELFSQPVELGLNYEVTRERRKDFDLVGTTERGRTVIDHELKVDARWKAGPQTAVFVQAVVLADQRKDLADGAVRKRHSFERGQTWLLVDGVGGLPLSVQAGRIALIDRRSWWWDDDMDAVRLSYTADDTTSWRVDTGLARELLKRSSADAGIAPERRGVTRWFGHATANWQPDHALEGFWLAADDRSRVPTTGSLFDAGSEDASHARLAWLGLRASGQWRLEEGHRFSYRADAAYVYGRETITPFSEAANGQLIAGTGSPRRVRGHAWDLGAQWRFPGEARPTISLGLASGSGGADSDVQDRNFRQTGLQENKSRIGGVKRWRFYGELLDPELSNLQVASAGFGLRVFGNNSAEMVMHRYRQNVASTRLAGSRLAEDPQGQSRNIGRELDLLFALREWRHLELTLKLGRFQPGNAFAEERRDPAHSVEVGATLNF